MSEKQRAIVLPQMYGLESLQVQRQINSDVRAMARTMLKQQGYEKKNVEVWTEDYIHLNDKGLLSWALDVYAFRYPAAHGVTVRRSQTFDLTDGTLYKLSDFFEQGSDYLKRISRAIEQQIEERDLPLIREFRRIKADQDYYLTEENLVIYFQAYEYTPYAVGLPEFQIPYSLLHDLIDTHSPLARLMPGD